MNTNIEQRQLKDNEQAVTVIIVGEGGYAIQELALSKDENKAYDETALETANNHVQNIGYALEHGCVPQYLNGLLPITINDLVFNPPPDCMNYDYGNIKPEDAEDILKLFGKKDGVIVMTFYRGNHNNYVYSFEVYKASDKYKFYDDSNPLLPLPNNNLIMDYIHRTNNKIRRNSELCEYYDKTSILFTSDL